MLRRASLLFTLLIANALVALGQQASNSYSLNVVFTPLATAANGDFNGDGKLDFATLCHNQILVYLGRGDGFPLQRPTPKPSSCLPQTVSAASGDFNHDGKTDVVFVDGDIIYGLGNGSGGFQTGTLTYPTLPLGSDNNPPGNATPKSVYVGDFNNDGYSDILIVDNAYTGSNYVVYLANKTGGFASPVVNQLHDFVGRWFSIGDMNHDGCADLVSAYQTELSNCDGTFRLLQSASNSYNPYGNTLLGDFNGDGNLDSLFFDTISNSFLFFAGTGTGEFLPPETALAVSTAPPPAATDPTSEAMLDINGDGVPDLVYFGPNSTVENAPNAYYWAQGNGDGTFKNVSFLAGATGVESLGDLQSIQLENGANPAMLNPIGYLFLPTTSPAAVELGDYEVSLGFYIDLGTITLGRPASAGFPLRSIGAGTLTVSGLLAQTPFEEQDNCLGSLGSASIASNCAVNVSINPTAAGTYTGNLSITSNASATPLNIPLFATVVGPQSLFTASPSTLNFGNQTIGSDTTLSVAFTTTNGQPETVSGLTLSGSGFSSSTSCRGQITACTANITFGPSTVGTFTGSVSLADENGLAATVQLTGTGIAASTQPTLSSSSLTFANQAVSTTSTAQSVTLTNPSSTALQIQSISASSGFLVSSNCGTALNAKSSCALMISFAPSAVGSQTGAVTIVDNAPNTPQAITLSGTGTAAAALTVAPASLLFGNQAVQTTSAGQSVTLSNAGSTALQIQSMIASTGFSVVNGCGTVLNANASCTLTVSFAPLAVGSQSGTVTVFDNASNGPQIITLSGTGTPQPAPLLSISPGSLAFGNQTIATTSSGQSVTLANTGNAPLDIQAILASAGFASTSNCGTSLNPGSSCTLTIAFAPTVAGAQSGTINIFDNAMNSPQTVALTGTGTEPPPASLTVTPASLSFSALVGTTSGVQTVSIANSGGQAADLQSIAASTGFTAVNGCPATLAPGASCTVGVSFSAGNAGTQSGTLTIQDNVSGSPQVVNLSGAGTEVTLGAASGSSTSATINSGQTATYHLAVTPMGGFTGTLAVSCTGAPAGMQCNGSPATLTITGNTPVTATFTVSPSPSAATAKPLTGVMESVTLVALCGLFSGAFRRKSKRLAELVMILAVCVLALNVTACGGGSTATTAPEKQSTTYVLSAVLSTPSGQQVQQPLVLTVVTSD